MSTLVVSNISDGTTSVPSSVVTEGAAKAVAHYDQSIPSSLNATSNVSSYTDVATGDFDVNFTNVFGAEPAGAGSSGDESASTNYPVNITMGASSCSHDTPNRGSTSADCDHSGILYMGDLA